MIKRKNQRQKDKNQMLPKYNSSWIKESPLPKSWKVYVINMMMI